MLGFKSPTGRETSGAVNVLGCNFVMEETRIMISIWFNISKRLFSSLEEMGDSET